MQVKEIHDGSFGVYGSDGLVAILPTELSAEMVAACQARDQDAAQAQFNKHLTSQGMTPWGIGEVAIDEWLVVSHYGGRLI